MDFSRGFLLALDRKSGADRWRDLTREFRRDKIGKIMLYL